MSARAVSVLLAACFAAASAAVTAAAGPQVERRSAPHLEAHDLSLDGELVSAASAGDELWLLVAPPDAPDAPRTLLLWNRTRPAALELRASALDGWIKTLAIAEVADGERELWVGGLARLASLGPLATAGAEPPRTLLDDADFDLRSLARGRLRAGPERSFVVAQAGRWRRFDASAGGVTRAGSGRLPLEVEVDRGGLRLSSPPGERVAFAGSGGRADRLLIGPEARGRARLRTLIVPLETASDPAQESAPVEVWAQLPAPEEVEQHAFVELDGATFLVVRSQGSEALNIFEEQRLRVLPLVADRTRAGAAPTFAATLDSKRWHEIEFATGDPNRDGRSDLLVARPEGMRGKDLVLEAYLGLGGGRFERRPRRIDIEGPFELFRYRDDLDGDALPDLLTLRERTLELRRGVARSGPVERKPFATLELRSAARATTSVSVGVGGDGARAKSERAGSVELLGLLSRTGLSPANLPPAILLTSVDDDGRERLLVVAAR